MFRNEKKNTYIELIVSFDIIVLLEMNFKKGVNPSISLEFQTMHSPSPSLFFNKRNSVGLLDIKTLTKIRSGIELTKCSRYFKLFAITRVDLSSVVLSVGNIYKKIINTKQGSVVVYCIVYTMKLNYFYQLGVNPFHLSIFFF